MPPGGGAAKRKRPERSYSQDNNLAEQPPTKSPRGSRFPNNVQANPHSQGYNRDNAQRGGRGGNRGGRPANNSSNPPRRPPTASGSTPTTPSAPTPLADATPVRTEPQPQTAKEQDTAMEEAPQPIPTPLLPRHYDTITDELVQSWKETGRQVVIGAARDAVQAENPVRLGCLFQEILFSGLDGRIDAPEAGDTIKQIINEVSSVEQDVGSDLEVSEAFLDTVAVSCFKDDKNPRLRQILLGTGISPETLMINLSDDMLEGLKLVRLSWSRMAIRHQTNALYRQANYNLLREETEGYSKLVTELFTTIENEESTIEAAKNSFERVKSMIGAFNLDVGRVLDVTMDVFAAILVEHSPFLVRFLYSSTWWPRDPTTEARHANEINIGSLPSWVEPADSLRDSVATDLRYERDEIFWTRVKAVGLKAFFELGARRAETSELDNVLPILADDTESSKDKDPKTPTIRKRSNVLRKWIEDTGTLPPQGNEDAAQILGFKLRFYNSAARDPDDTLPSNLIYLAALLIKIGFISFLDLYPHLWPSDDEMAAMRPKLEKEKDEREKDRKPGGKNALELAGALVDDTLPPPPRKLPEPAAKPVSKTGNTADETGAKSEAKGEEAKKLPDPVEQKIQLLKSLLCIGAIPEALFILGQFPWMMDLVPELPQHINRILHQSLSLVYDQTRPLIDIEGIQEPEKFADPDQTAAQKGYVSLTSILPRKSSIWAQIDKADGSDGIDYKFYWNDWIDNVPLCHTVDDVFQLCNTFMNLNGFKIGQDPLLIAKLARIGLYSLDSDTSEENKNRWIYLCKRLLVPALSLADRNAGSVAEVWNLLKRFPTYTRYNIYFEWYLGQTSRNNDIKSAFNYSQAETKDVLKKISKTNTRPMARLLAKVAVASPGKVFEVVIKQIESYDNLISVVVEASRYFTDLGYDVLTWSLINALGKARGRVQSDGMLTSRWLSKLAQFCGTVFKRYAVMNPIPVLQYATNQLLGHNSTDLVVLEHLVYSMAGITQDATFNESQVIAMCGGPVLRSNTMTALLDQRADPNMRNSTKRLMKALSNSHLTGALLIGISQERQSCIFDVDEADAHLKLLGNFFDEIHRVLTQYIDLLQTNLADQEFKSCIPSLAELIGEYGIEAPVAFWIWRPTIASDIAAYDKLLAEKTTASNAIITAEPPSKDLEMVDPDQTDALTEPDKAEAMEVAEQVQDNTEDTNGVLETIDTRLVHPVVEKLIESVKPALPQTIFEMISDSFYFTFWRLSPYDLHIPDTYQEESRRLTARIEQLKNERGGTSNDARNREAQRKQLTEQSSKIAAELKDHLSSYQKSKVALNKEKDLWFQLNGGSWDDLNVAILEHCFIPRMTLSSVESFFVFRMLKLLHTMGAKNFRTMALLDCFFNGKRMLPLFFACTAKEAENLGRFINEVVKDLNKWHASKDIYEKEAFGAKKDLPGFKKNLSVADSFLDHESFRTLYAKWHRNLHDALRECLKSPEYMHIRNAIIILKTVVQVFPAVEWMGKNLEEAVKLISVGEERGDLKLSAVALSGILKRRSSQWVAAQVFARHKPGQANGPPGTRSATTPARSPAPTKSPAETPQPSKTLNAKAPDFVPGALSIDPARKRDVRGEAEDGEIRTPTTAKLPMSSSASASGLNTSEQAKPPSKTDDKTSSQAPVTKSSERANERNASHIPSRPLPESKRQELPPRPENTSRPPSYHSRQPEPPRNHNLASRAENPSNSSRIQDSRAQDRPMGRGHTRESNDPRDSGYRQNDRSLESSRGPESDHRTASRAYERPYHSERDRQEPSWGGDRNSSSRGYDDQAPHPHSRTPLKDEKADRPQRDAPLTDSRDRYRSEEAHESGSRDNSRASRPNMPAHSDRTSLLKTAQEQDRNQHVGHSDRRHDSTRSDHDHVSSSRGSRGSSPIRRGEDVSSRSDYKRYDDRSAPDSRRPAEPTPPRSRHDDTRSYHNSRSEYHGEGASSSHGEHSRDDQRNTHPSRQDANSGWGFKPDSRPPARQQDSNYGRLNQDAGGSRSNDPNAVPVAPRHTRQSGTQNDTSDSRNPAASSSAPAPSGPSSNRGPPRSASGYTRPPPISTTMPPAPSTSSSPDTAGIHPERLKALQGSSIPSKPPPSQAPVGPRNAVPDSMPARPPPSGPNSSDGGRGRSDKRFAQLNTVLSQTNGSPVSDRPNQAPQTRGRAEQGGETSSPISNGPVSRSMPPSADSDSGPRSNHTSSRAPPNPSRSEDNRRPQRSDDRPPRPQDSQSENIRQRPPLQNNSRDYMRPPPPSGDSRDGRGRGSAPHPQTPPMHQHQDRERRSTRGDNMQGTSDRNGRRDSGRDDWQDHRSGQRRDTQQSQSQPPPPAQQQDNTGSGRKRGRGSEEMYDQGPVPYDHGKRPRRG